MILFQKQKNTQIYTHYINLYKNTNCDILLDMEDK